MNPATLWARVLVDELVRSGVRHLALAPGSRSTPLVLAAAAEAGLRRTVHLDERSAAFFALGVGNATGMPAAVLTTSGTAVANLLPATVEAAWSETPLLLLTADRPRRLRDAGANQAIHQPGIFGPYVRESFDLAEPALDEAGLRNLRSVACRAVASARGLPAGPVHLNVPFDKPLEPDPDGAEPGPDVRRAFPLAMDGRGDGAPLTRVEVRRPLPGAAELEEVAGRLRAARRPVLVAGPVPDPGTTGPSLLRLARAAGTPLLADPLSGARWTGDETDAGGESMVLTAYDLVLSSEAARSALAPDLVLRVGAIPTSAPTVRWLEAHDRVPQLLVDPAHRWKDPGPALSGVLPGDPARTLEALRRRLREAGSAAEGLSPSGDGAPEARRGWLRRWRGADEAARSVAEAAHDEGPFEGTILADVAAFVPPESPLVVSSSMPVRDLDAFGGPRHAALLAVGNRGASGIDGVVSTALGVAAGAGSPVVCALGDLAFVHDMNGLLATREAGVAAVFVVIHNDGGGIFHMLPVAEHEPWFTPYFATPHGLDFRHAAELHRLPHRRLAWDGPADRHTFREALGHALEEAREHGRSSILEVRTERRANHLRRREVRARAAEAALEALGRVT